MDQVALNWLVLVMTNSPFYLGLQNLFRAIPILGLTLVAGVIADRMERWQPWWARPWQWDRWRLRSP